METIGDITDEAVQKYINEQAEDSREEDTRRYKKIQEVPFCNGLVEEFAIPPF